MPTYRVFVTRHYIDVEFYDIECSTAKKAEKVAERAAKKLIPDSRSRATDNGWHSEDALEIEGLGFPSAPDSVERVYKEKDATVYMDKRQS